MERIKLIFKSLYSIDAIYKLRKAPFWMTFIAAVILGIIQMAPFTLLFLQVDTYRWDQNIWELNEEYQELMMMKLSNDCTILGGSLSCSEFHEFKLGENVIIQFNGENDNVLDGISFEENFFVFTHQGQPYQLSYQSLEGIDFSELQTKEDGYDILFRTIAYELRNTLALSFILGTYQTGIFSFLVFTFVITSFSMLFKFGNSNFPKFKEALNIIIFSSILPIFIALIVGIFNPALTLLIYNVGTPLRAYCVYRKKFVSEFKR